MLINDNYTNKKIGSNEKKNLEISTVTKKNRSLFDSYDSSHYIWQSATNLKFYTRTLCYLWYAILYETNLSHAHTHTHTQSSYAQD